MPQVALIGAAALEAVQVPLEAPPYSPLHVQVVVPPATGKTGLAGVVVSPTTPHIVPEKAESV